MFDITINMADMFRGLFSKNRVNEDKLKILEQTIKNESDVNIIISEVLFKLTNGTFDSCLLYEYLQDNINTPILRRQIGDYERFSINYSYLICIPLFIEQKLKFQLLLISKKKVKINKYHHKLLDLLEEYLNNKK